MKVFLSVLSVTFFLSVNASAAIGDTWGGQSRIEIENFNTSADLKRKKKAGVGTSLAGALGLVGLNLNINFAEDFTFVVGYGVSHGFHAVNMNFKQSLGGEALTPYFSGGFSRWFSRGEEGETLEKTTPSFLKEKFLSAKEIRTGQFAENIIYPGFGLEYMNTKGDWQGLSFYVEILYLLDIDDLEAAPTAGIGTNFYF